MTGKEIYNKFYKDGTDEYSKDLQLYYYWADLGKQLEVFYILLKEAHEMGKKVELKAEYEDVLLSSYSPAVLEVR